MKPALFTILALLTVSHALRADRPIVETLTETKTISFDVIDISLRLPTGTELVGPNHAGEPMNYVFPWVRIPLHGRIDVAYAPKDSAGKTFLERVNEACRLFLARIETMSPEGNINVSEIGGVQFARAAFKGGGRVSVVRYYFLTDDQQLAFFHLWGGVPSVKQLEEIIKSTTKNRTNRSS